jgi:hypothetical protein
MLKTFKTFITESLTDYSKSLSKAEVQDIRDKEGITFSTDKGHPTQRSSTKATYLKFYNLLPSEIRLGQGLDYSAGLGLGSDILRSVGASIDSYEPFPHEDAKDITYAGLNSLPNKQYNYIINSVVLNVVEQDLRDEIVLDIWEHLLPGGCAIFGVRSKADVLSAKTAYIINYDNGEVIDRTRGSYQKGFTSSELFAYIQDLLPDAALRQVSGLSQVVVMAFKDEEHDI